MKYKVGDKVRVRSWESMENEFGLDGFGNIDMNTHRFAIGMKKYCKKVVEIVVIKENFYIVAGNSWTWTDEMLEPVFDWESFKNPDNKIAVHCKTEEEAKNFCRQMHEHGMKWSSGSSCLEYNHWRIHREDTCYVNDVCFSSIRFYNEKNYTILEYADYFTKEKQKLFIPKKCRRVLKQINKEYKWIAKDADGKVYIYKCKPIKKEKLWLNSNYDYQNLTEIFDDSLFDWLSWEDEEPVNFREILKGRKERYDR